MKKFLKTLLLKFNLLKPIIIKRELGIVNTSTFSESDVIAFFFKYFDFKGTLVDVGAHYGESFLPYERFGWKIYAFEPDSNNRKKIVSSSSKTEIFDVAISDEDNKELVLYSSNESTGISSLIPFHQSHKPFVTIKTRTLKSFCKEKGIDNIDFLKIDTEGFDLFVLKGFPFDQITPKVILCEFEDKKTIAAGYSYKDLGEFLLRKGYHVFISEWYPIVKYGIEHVWREIADFPDYELKDESGWGNFIAVHPDYLNRFNKAKNLYLNSLNVKTK